MNDIIQAEELEQYEVNDLYQATQLLLQDFQRTKEEEHPGKINEIIEHLKKRLAKKAAYPLAVLLECTHLSIRHQLEKEWNSAMKQRQLFLFEGLIAQFRGKVPPGVWNQISLNYAEALLQTGRSIDSLAVLDGMIETENEPFFERQGAERGWALVFYSTFLKNKAEKAKALHTARELLQRSQTDISDEKGRKLYAERLKIAVRMLEQLGAVDVTEDYRLELHQGREKEYRDWCAKHRLLLNGTNDIDPQGTLKLDSLTYRSKSTDKERTAYLAAYLEALTTEFTAMRWNLFEALDLEPKDPNRNERLKNVYRQAFSLFDKVGPFINQAYKLDVPEPRAGMQRIWFEEEHPQKPLKPFIKDAKNDALKALYWQSKELFGYERSDRQNLMMIRAQHLRQQMERGFVQVVAKPEDAIKEGDLRKHQMTQKELE
ncbi:MAG TPA: LA2681 family HEPN domain-containing protein, partial [Planococcus sp. (in: firmicutes)]|nr:LA2681 family HEPN domain-containing protein [Planococcus sp. (in: firmicutes)]